MPRERPRPGPFEPEALERSLNRYLVMGLVFMLVLIAGFVAYRVREPSLRADATNSQRTTYTKLGKQLFAANCAECHGDNGSGGGDAPTLDSKEFLANASDAQMHALISGGVSGTQMSAWSLDFGGTMTDEQVRQLVTYVRSLEKHRAQHPQLAHGRNCALVAMAAQVAFRLTRAASRS